MSNPKQNSIAEKRDNIVGSFIIALQFSQSKTFLVNKEHNTLFIYCQFDTKNSKIQSID